MEAKKIQIHGDRFSLYLSEKQLQVRIDELAEQIDSELRGERPLFLAILNGSFIFAADLFRRITIEAEISFIKLASYKGQHTTGQVITAIGLEESIKDRTVVILEDIIDTGETLHYFIPQLQKQQPREIRIAALLSKPEAGIYSIKIDYLGFSIPDKFIVGYGLDYDGLGRNLRHIYQISE